MTTSFKVLILSIASLLVMGSCSKQSEVPAFGQFSKYKIKSQYRMPASSIDAKSTLIKFEKFQDTKQILVHCQLDSKHTRSCYREIFDKRLNAFAKKEGSIKSDALSLIKTVHSFDNVKDLFQGLDNHILSQVNPKIANVVKKRSDFCRENSKENLHKCLNQFVKRDTFMITNSMQREGEAMNGQEYLYVKSMVEHDLKEKLFYAKVQLKKKTTF